MSGTCSTGKDRSEDEQRQQRLSENLARIRHRWLVLSGKGGVGKSTVAVNLACALVRRGRKVGLLDVDIHGPNVAKMLGIEDRKLTSGRSGMTPVKLLRGLKVVSMASLMPDSGEAVIWRGPRKMGAIRQFLADVDWGDLDHLVVDAPPGTGDEPLSAAQLIGEADGAIIVTTPQEMSLLDCRKCVNFARQVGLPITGIIENMSGLFCPHCHGNIDLFGAGGGQDHAEHASAKPPSVVGQEAGGARVAIPALDDAGLDARVDPRFGRAPYFVVLDARSGDLLSVLPNTAAGAAHGAGTGAAKVMADNRVNAVIAGRFGPKALAVLQGLGIEQWLVPDGLTVGQTLARLRAGELARVR